MPYIGRPTLYTLISHLVNVSWMSTASLDNDGTLHVRKKGEVQVQSHETSFECMVLHS